MLNHKRYPFTAWAISSAPEDPGVYGLWLDGELIYIGSASSPGATIQSRLADHLSQQGAGGAKIATEYAWELSRNPRAREIELLEEYRRQFLRYPLLNRHGSGAG